jgi:predicted MFS family arabinose efflux permease
MAGKVSFDGISRSLRNRNYAIYTYSNTAAMVGEWIQRVGIGWLTWELTASTTWLGIIACTDMVPAMLMSPFAGAYADRSDRLRFTQKTVALTSLQPLVLSCLYFLDVIDIWLLLPLALYNGLLGAFNQAARLAIIPHLVSRADLSPAVALSSITYNISRFIGPAIAGTLIASVGVGYSFIINLLFFIVFTASLFFITLNDEESPRRRNGHILTDTLEGLRYTMRHPGIGPVMFLLIVGSLGQRPFIELLPGFAGRIFERGPEAFGWMVSMIGMGALAGAVYLGIRPSLDGLTRIAVHMVLIGAIMLIGFALIGDFHLAMACLLVIGASLSISATGVMTLVQSSVDGHMRGRVLSLYGLVFRGGPAIGAFLMGFAAEQIGLQIPVILGAAFCILLWAWVTRNLPRTAAALETESRPHP